MKISPEEIPFEGREIALTTDLDGMAEALRSISVGTNPVEVGGQLSLLPIQNSPAIHVSGQLNATIHQKCSRCLEPVGVKVEEQFQLMLQPSFGVSDEEEEIDLDPESLDISVFGEEGIDVPEVVREQILLCVPFAVLCKEDCKGICQRCGSELNIEPCRCDTKPVDPRFAALTNLKLSN